MKIKRTRKQSAPRNSVAKALGNPLFRQRVVKNPNAYRRRPKHTVDIARVEPPADADE